MPGSTTTPGRRALAMARPCVLPSAAWKASAPGMNYFAAQWLAYAYPCQRFAVHLAGACA
jgi:hypothetical protein